MGQYVPVTWNGQTSRRLNPGEGIWTDWIDVPFTENGLVTYQFRVNVDGPGQFFLPALNRFLDRSRTCYSNGNATTPVPGLSDLASNRGSRSQLVRPWFWHGLGKPKFAALLLFGDSLFSGQHDTPSEFAPYPTMANGFATRGTTGSVTVNDLKLYDPATYTPGGAAVVNFSIGGDSLESSQPSAIPRRLALIPEVMGELPYIAWINSGANDYFLTTPVGPVLSHLAVIANHLRSIGAARVLGATLIPRSTSSDEWTTDLNQTVAFPQWQEHNALLRTSPETYGLDEVIDINAGMRNTTDPSSLWRIFDRRNNVTFDVVGAPSNTTILTSGTGLVDLTKQNRYLDWALRMDTGPNAGLIRRVALSQINS